jgi:hypothetical protein
MHMGTGDHERRMEAGLSKMNRMIPLCSKALGTPPDLQLAIHSGDQNGAFRQNEEIAKLTKKAKL